MNGFQRFRSDFQKFAKLGVPMLVFIIGGSYGLSKVVVGKFDAQERDQQIIEQYLKEQGEDKPIKKFNLEEELAQMKKEMKENDWKVVYIERPKD